MPSLKELQTGRVALVLMGGGAKGAYEVGVWKALWDLGIRRFCTIAGTSVGALNAALVAQHDPKKVEEIWTSIMTTGVLEAPKRRWRRRLLWCLAYVLSGESQPSDQNRLGSVVSRSLSPFKYPLNPIVIGALP
ncbi:hypothetical protein GMSM_44280 [Geomonas sp. Red276]